MNDKYDLAVIGAGPGGYVAAIRASQLGLKTICIDKRAELGGTCLNVGCIPSKALLQSTELFAHLQHDGQEHGISVSGLTIDFSHLMERKKQIVKNLIKGIEGSFKSNHVDFLQGQARFIDAHHLTVEGNDGKINEIESTNILIATGSESIALPNLSFDEQRVLSSTGALNLPAIPKQMIVVGAGSIGLELASVYNRLGTEVVVVEMLDRICCAMDRSISQRLLSILKKQGITFLLSTQVITAVAQPKEVFLTVANDEKLQNLSADVVLVAVGRRPYTQGLDLNKVGIQVDKKGFVSVNKAFQTSHENIFAIGDCIEGSMLAHKASEEGIAVVEMLAKQRISPVSDMTIPNVIYTYPEAASVGMTEDEAKQANLDIMVGESQFKANPRARCAGETEGFVKVIGEKHSGRLIGLHILGSHASELIGEGMIAISKQSLVRDLAYAPHAHPSLSEAIKEAALSALSPH